MHTRKLREFLDGENIKYVVISHSPAFTMSEIAAVAHISGKKVAKTVMIEVDGKMAMAVVPSPYKVELGLLKDVTGARKVRISTEKEFKELFPGCEPGAMPPFGNLYGMDVFVSPELAEADEIAFNAGSHTELVRLAFADFERLVQPKIPATSFGVLGS